MRTTGRAFPRLSTLFSTRRAAIENESHEPSELSGAGSRRRLLLPLIVFAVCALAYSLLHVAFISRGVESRTDGDEVQYLVLTESIIQDHDLSPLNQYTEKVYLEHGYYDKDIPYPSLVPGYGGRLVYSHMPAMSFLLVPGFWMFGYHGAAATMILLVSLAAAFAFAVIRRFAKDNVALVGTLLFFLSYPLVTYSRLLYTETVMVFLLPLTMWACLRLSETRRTGYAVLAGIGAGLMLQFHLKYAALAAATVFLLFVCSKDRRRDLVAWAVPVAASCALFIGLTLYLYGQDLVYGLTVSSGPGGFLGGGPFWGIFGLYLDRAWGLFIFAPLYFAFLPGLPVPKDRKGIARWWAFIPIAIVLQTLAVGLFGKWSGEVSPVPRHLVPLLPVLVICAALFYDRLRSALTRALVCVLVALQVVLTVFALLNPMSVFAIHGPENALIPKILGNNFLSKSLVRIFPLFHPVRLKSGILLLVIWVLLLTCASFYIKKKAMYPLYEGPDPGAPLVE